MPRAMGRLNSIVRAAVIRGVASAVRDTDNLETLSPPPSTETSVVPPASSSGDQRSAEQPETATVVDELADDSEDRPTWRPAPPPAPRAKPAVSGVFEAVPSSKRRLRQRAG
jgi:hypothetical protein